MGHWDDNLPYAGADAATARTGALFFGNSGNRTSTVGDTTSYNYCHGINIDASRSSPIYGTSDTVQPAALNCKFCIKY